MYGNMFEGVITALILGCIGIGIAIGAIVFWLLPIFWHWFVPILHTWTAP
jgi:hypothetical protein